MFAIQKDYSTAVGSIRTCKVDFQGQLDTDTSELLSGTPTVTPSPTGPSVAAIARNSAAMTVDGVNVPIDMGVQFRIQTFTADTEYTIDVQCATTDGNRVQLTLPLAGTGK